MANLRAYDSTCLVIVKHLGSRFNSHCFDGIHSLIVRRDEGFNFAAKVGIVSTDLRQNAERPRRVSLKY